MKLIFLRACVHVRVCLVWRRTLRLWYCIEAPSRALAVPAWEPRLRHSHSFCGSFACSIMLDGVAAVEKTCIHECRPLFV